MQGRRKTRTTPSVSLPALPLRHRAAVSRPARATPEAMAAAIKKVVGDNAIREGRVTLDMPPLIENGNTVPLTVSVESPMTEADHVKAIHVFNEKNPQPHVFDAWLAPRNGKAMIGTRIKLGDTQKIVAIAETSKGEFWQRQRRRDRHARRLPGGPDYGQRPDQRAQDRQEGRGHRDQGADPASHGDRLPARHQRPHHSAQHHRALHRDLERREIFRMDLSPAIAANPFVSFFAVATESGKIRCAGPAMKASPSRSPSRSTLHDLRRRLALVLLPAVFAASFALAQAHRTGADKRRSGYQDMGAALQKMQDDDTANPGMLFVQPGQQLWAKKAGAANKSCADCHPSPT